MFISLFTSPYIVANIRNGNQPQTPQRQPAGSLSGRGRQPQGASSHYNALSVNPPPPTLTPPQSLALSI